MELLGYDSKDNLPAKAKCAWTKNSNFKAEDIILKNGEQVAQGNHQQTMGKDK